MKIPITFYEEIPLKIDNDTKKYNFNNPLQFYKRNRIKNERHKKPLQFYTRKPFINQR